MSQKNTDSTVIIVTDLFIYQRNSCKNAERIKVLKRNFNNGKSIEFCISSSYNGKISGIPTEGGEGYLHTQKQLKGFFIIVIGDGQDINF